MTKKKSTATQWPRGKQKVLESERWRTRSHCPENTL